MNIQEDGQNVDNEVDMFFPYIIATFTINIAQQKHVFQIVFCQFFIATRILGLDCDSLVQPEAKPVENHYSTSRYIDVI